jgi:hypothetical protein
MNPIFHFRSRLSTGGEIFAQPTAILPVQPGRPDIARPFCTLDSPLLADFMPVLNFTRKNLTVAQPLLREARK